MSIVEDFLASNEDMLLQSFYLGALVFAAIAEGFFPRRAASDGLAFRWANNLALAVVNQVVFTALVILLTTTLISSLSSSEGWLSGSVPFGLWSGFVVTTLLLELFGYFLHRLFHSVPWLWRIHAVHHSDTELDFTTTLRAHPVETMVLLPVTGPLILMLGLPVASLVLYLIVRICLITFCHSNIYLPPAVDRVLRYVIVTPDFHRMHHSSNRKYTDSNYSIAFPWFDYLFGTHTRQPFKDHENMEIGLEYFRDRKDSRIDRLLMCPFRWRRD